VSIVGRQGVRFPVEEFRRAKLAEYDKSNQDSAHWIRNRAKKRREEMNVLVEAKMFGDSSQIKKYNKYTHHFNNDARDLYQIILIHIAIEQISMRRHDIVPPPVPIFFSDIAISFLGVILLRRGWRTARVIAVHAMEAGKLRPALVGRGWRRGAMDR
jgi:hypothetical protein